MAYYYNIKQQDREVPTWDNNGDEVIYQKVRWQGPYEFESEALEHALLSGWGNVPGSITIIDFGD